jgi:hypothetical protein
MTSLSEATPLLRNTSSTSTIRIGNNAAELPWRNRAFAFLEAKTPSGARYEQLTIFLIVMNVLAFILGSLFIEDYNGNIDTNNDDKNQTTAVANADNTDNFASSWTSRTNGVCGSVCDGLFFGNYEDNILAFLNIGSTSVLEIVTVAIFSVDYIMRVYLADLENPNQFSGIWGRIRYLPTFYSLVDLASTVPFYVDSFVLRNSNLVASQVSRTSISLFSLEQLPVTYIPFVGK